MVVNGFGTLRPWRPTSFRSANAVSAAASISRSRRHAPRDRKSTRLNSSHSQISYAVFCLKKKKTLLVDLAVVAQEPGQAGRKRLDAGRPAVHHHQATAFGVHPLRLPLQPLS